MYNQVTTESGLSNVAVRWQTRQTICLALPVADVTGSGCLLHLLLPHPYPTHPTHPDPAAGAIRHCKLAEWSWRWWCYQPQCGSRSGRSSVWKIVSFCWQRLEGVVSRNLAETAVFARELSRGDEQTTVRCTRDRRLRSFMTDDTWQPRSAKTHLEKIGLPQRLPLSLCFQIFVPFRGEVASAMRFFSDLWEAGLCLRLLTCSSPGVYVYSRGKFIFHLYSVQCMTCPRDHCVTREYTQRYKYKMKMSMELQGNRCVDDL